MNSHHTTCLIEWRLRPPFDSDEFWRMYTLYIIYIYYIYSRADEFHPNTYLAIYIERYWKRFVFINIFINTQNDVKKVNLRSYCSKKFFKQTFLLPPNRSIWYLLILKNRHRYGPLNGNYHFHIYLNIEILPFDTVYFYLINLIHRWNKFHIYISFYLNPKIVVWYTCSQIRKYNICHIYIYIESIL